MAFIHVLEFHDLRPSAEGYRNDAWEGAAEDSIAFVTAALETNPEIDPERLAVYGYSRGGGVALIHGQRDVRVRAVLAFAGPTDFFSQVGRPGVDWPRRLTQAYADPAPEPYTRESQFLDWFVRDRGGEDLRDIRRA